MMAETMRAAMGSASSRPEMCKRSPKAVAVRPRRTATEDQMSVEK